MVEDLFYKVTEEMGYNFFTGVPDSLLKSFQEKLYKSSYENIIATHESQARV